MLMMISGGRSRRFFGIVLYEELVVFSRTLFKPVAIMEVEENKVKRKKVKVRESYQKLMARRALSQPPFQHGKPSRKPAHDQTERKYR